MAWEDKRLLAAAQELNGRGYDVRCTLERHFIEGSPVGLFIDTDDREVVLSLPFVSPTGGGPAAELERAARAIEERSDRRGRRKK